MGTTPTYSWPYPEPTDPVANGAQDIEDLALAVETTVSGITGGKILQVVSTTKTDTFSTSSTTFTDITGLAVSITPSSATSKVFVIVRANTACSTVANMAFRLMRDSTPIEVGAASGSKSQATSKVTIAGGNYVMDTTGTYLDSPATTSAISYHLEMMVQSGTGTINYITTENDVAGARDARTASTITALEVSA